jgi:hypothetical protein
MVSVEPQLETWDRYPGRDHKAVNEAGAEHFMDIHEGIDFVSTPRNVQLLIDFCDSHKVPTSFVNLEIGQRLLWQYFDKEEPPEPPPAADLSKLADDPSLSSHARNQRFAKLKQAAVAERIHLANARRPRNWRFDLGG